MKKKVLAALLTFTMVAGMLSGCGSKTGSGEELTVWLPAFAGNDSSKSDEDFWAEQFKPFEEENNCKINLEVVPWDNYEEKYLTGVNSDEGPDVGYMYMEMFYDYIKMGALEPLETYFKEEDTKNYLYYDLGNFNGVQYALPAVVGNPRIFVANMDILNAAGIDKIPETWDELVTACKAVQAYDSNVYPIAQEWGNTHYGSLNEIYWPFFWAAGGEITDADGNPNINTEAGLKATEFLYGLKKDGILTDSATSIDDQNALFKSGQAAMAVVATSLAASYDEAGIHWDFTPCLAGPAGSGKTFVAADSLVMFSKCKDKELAAKVMKFITSPKVMEAFHTNLYSMPPISTEEEYKDLPEYQEMYKNDTAKFQSLPVFEGATSFYDTLYKNLQSMLMDEMTPQEVLDNTMSYYNESIKTKSE